MWWRRAFLRRRAPSCSGPWLGWRGLRSTSAGAFALPVCAWCDRPDYVTMPVVSECSALSFIMDLPFRLSKPWLADVPAMVCDGMPTHYAFPLSSSPFRWCWRRGGFRASDNPFESFTLRADEHTPCMRQPTACATGLFDGAGEATGVRTGRVLSVSRATGNRGVACQAGHV
jgi:hypothetical protein